MYSFIVHKPSGTDWGNLRELCHSLCDTVPSLKNLPSPCLGTHNRTIRVTREDFVIQGVRPKETISLMIRTDTN